MSDKKYASDYRVEEISTVKGTEIRRTYTGTYYRFCRTEKEIRGLGNRLLAGTALILAAMGPLLFNNTQIGRCAYVLLPMAFSLIPLYQVGAVGWRLRTYPMKLTRQQRDLTQNRLESTLVWLTVMLGITALGTVFYLLRQGMDRGEWLPVAGVVISLGLALRMLPLRGQAKAEEEG